MRLYSALTAFTFAASVFGVPNRVPIIKHAGPVKANSYIVRFEHTESKNAFVKRASSLAQRSVVTHDYDIIPAIAIWVGGVNDLGILQGTSGVKSIEPDTMFSVDYEEGFDGFDPEGYKQSSSPSEPQFERRADINNQGEGVCIYIVDTGINREHECFGGRASYGIKIMDGVASSDADDDNGHGTHTAGTAGGEIYGQAPKSQIVAVKVLKADGSGSTSDIVSGIEWVVKDFNSNGKPAVMSMSLGGLSLLSFCSGLISAVNKAISSGIHTTIAAGNNNLPVITSSPALVKAAITVGAVDSTDTKASFSNYGKLIDVWAPGVDVTSAWIGSASATKVLSGTSMACPYVAGIAAVAISRYGQVPPETLSQAIKDNSDKGVVKFAITDLVAMQTSTHDRAKKW